MENWVEEEFADTNFGDIRLNKRGQELLQSFGRIPGAPISQVFKTWKEIKACYRFFSNSRIKPENIISSHSRATINRIKSYPIVLLPTDTTSGDYTHKPSIRDLGRLAANQCGDNLGIYIHPTLAITPERLCLGIVGAKIWTREAEKSKLSAEEKKKRPIEEKESFRWVESYTLACKVAQDVPDTKIISITDREGDFTDLLSVVTENKRFNNNSADIIVRSCQDRLLDDKEPSTKKYKKLRNTLNNSDELGQIEFVIPKTKDRKKRIVKQTIKSSSIVFRGTNNRKIKINAVMAVEENPPEGTEPIFWILLTTLDVATLDDAVKVIEYYLCRWEIEIFNKILKSGCKIEEKQLQTADRLKVLIALFMVLAWRVQYLMMIGRSCPNIPCSDIFEENEWKSVFKILNRDKAIPKESPLLKDFIKMVAILGGYIGRNNDPDPGPKVMWKGLSRMTDFALAWEAFRDPSSA